MSGTCITSARTSVSPTTWPRSYPKKLAELKALFMTEAAKYNVLPIDDRTIERVNPELAGRPDLMGGRTSLVLYEGMEGMLENTFINVKNRSKTITAEIEIPAGGASALCSCKAVVSADGRCTCAKENQPTNTTGWASSDSSLRALRRSRLARPP